MRSLWPRLLLRRSSGWPRVLRNLLHMRTGSGSGMLDRGRLFPLDVGAPIHVPPAGTSGLSFASPAAEGLAHQQSVLLQGGRGKDRPRLRSAEVVR